MPKEQLRLCDIPKGSKIFITKPLEIKDGSEYVTFDHLDGMYSYCVSERGNVIHLSGGTPLKKVEGGYEIDHQI